MTTACTHFLKTLGAYLNAHGPAKRRELQELHFKLADGRKLSKVAMSRHLNFHTTPLMDTGIVYLRFAQINRIILSADRKVGLFRYPDPVITVKKRKARRKAVKNKPTPPL